MGVDRVVSLLLLWALVPGAPAAAQQVRQSESPLATGGLDIPDMRQVQQDWGHAIVAAEAARVVEQIGDLPTASRKLWDAHLSEVTFPVEVRGEAAGWFEAVSPLQEVDVSPAGLKGLWGAFPAVTVRRDRLAVTCVDETGMPVAHGPTLGGPEEVLPSGATVLYIIENVDDCWTDGGVKLVVHEADLDPLAAIADPTRMDGDMRAWAARSQAEAALMVLSGDPATEEMSGLFDVPVSSLDATLTPSSDLAVNTLAGTGFLDCRVAGPCPVNADCASHEICSCDDRGNVVTRDFDRDGCPDQRTVFSYDDDGRMKSSEHDWDNDGDSDQRCTYDPPCKPGDGGCSKKCADLVGR